MNWTLNRKPRIELKSGVVLSIQQGDGYYCGPNDFEVMPIGVTRCPYGWLKYIDIEPWTESSVFCHVTPEFLAQYITRQGISLHNARLLPASIRQCLPNPQGYTERDYTADNYEIHLHG